MQNPPILANLEVYFGYIVAAVLGFAGIAFFLLFIKGGTNLLTAGSDSGQIQGAKKTLTSAIMGMVLVLSAFLILTIIATFTGASGILIFDIYK